MRVFDVHDVKNMDRDALVLEILKLQDEVAAVRRLLAQKEATIVSLQNVARKSYQAASDYVPPMEDDYDR